jgi:hypothetical protein
VGEIEARSDGESLWKNFLNYMEGIWECWFGFNGVVLLKARCEVPMRGDAFLASRFG